MTQRELRYLQSTLLKSKDLYVQCVGHYFWAIFKRASKMCPFNQIAFEDYLQSGIYGALKAKEKVAKKYPHVLKDMNQLKRIFAKYVMLHVVNELKITRANVLLSINIPPSFQQNNILRSLKNKNLTVEDFMQNEISKNQGFMKAEQQHSKRYTNISKKQFVNGSLQVEFLEDSGDSPHEKDKSFSQKYFREQNLFTSEENNILNSPDFEIIDLLKILTEFEQFILLNYVFEKLTYKKIAKKCLQQGYAFDTDNIEKYIEKSLNNVFKKLKKELI